MQRAELDALILECLRDVMLELEIPVADSPGLGPETALLGGKSVLDSLGLVRLVLEVEQRVEDRYGASISLADERAMSQQRSPFRTVATLADYVETLAQEQPREGR